MVVIYERVDKIFGTVKKWSLVALDRWLFYAMLITTKYYLGGLVSGRLWRGGRFKEMVFKTGSTVLSGVHLSTSEEWKAELA